MRKKSIKNLSLKKNKISNLSQETVAGGALGSGFLSCAPEPLPTQRQTCQYSCVKKSCYCLPIGF